MKEGFLSFLPHEFNCPFCKKQFIDENEYYLNRCNNKRSGTIRVTCECKTCFYLSIDYTGKFHSYIQKK